MATEIALATDRPMASLMPLLVKCETDLTDEQFASLARFADGPPPATPPADEDAIREVVAFLAGALKAPRTGLREGRIKLGAYRLALTGIPADALEYAVTKAIKTLEWLPAPAELLKIASEFQAPELRAHEKAKLMTHRRRQRLFEETLRNIRDRKLLPEELAALDDYTAKCAETRGDLIIRLDGARQYRSKEALKAHWRELEEKGAFSLHQERDNRAEEAPAGKIEGTSVGDVTAGLLAGMEVSDGEV